MRTHGHREGNITHQGLSGGEARGGRARGGGDQGKIALGEIPNVDDRAMDAANHYHGMYIPM